MLEDGNNDEIAVETITFMQFTLVSRVYIARCRLGGCHRMEPGDSHSRPLCLAWAQKLFDIFDNLQGR